MEKLAIKLGPMARKIALYGDSFSRSDVLRNASKKAKFADEVFEVSPSRYKSNFPSMSSGAGEIAAVPKTSRVAGQLNIKEFTQSYRP